MLIHLMYLRVCVFVQYFVRLYNFFLSISFFEEKLDLRKIIIVYTRAFFSQNIENYCSAYG